MALKTSTVTVINCSDWDNLVKDTYGKPYCFQQQDGCQSRGTYNIVIPSEDSDSDMNVSIPEEVNGEEMGVRFETWLARNPDSPVNGDASSWMIELFWERNFYPDLQTVANDLHKKGLVEAGTYTIIIDW